MGIIKTLLLVVLFSLISCKSNDGEGYVNLPLAFEKPSNFPEIQYTLDNNPLTEKGFELGKKLFYDGKLSSDGVVSCAFCHIQSSAFTHHGHQFSHGVENRKGTRNSQPIQNLAFQKQFSWDGAAFHLDLFPIVPITNPDEMDETIGNVLDKIKKDKEYQKLFNLAFEDTEINADNTFKALSQFMVMMISSNSKYDKYIRKELGGDFTTNELNGLQIFKNKCATCHITDLFTDDSFRNNGLPVNPMINDLGRMRVTLLEEDKYKFKVPSLRNVVLTGPYMHDGRFGTLQSVLNFYSEGVKETENLDSLMKKKEGSIGIDLSNNDKENLIAFLKTLTDEEFINDKRFAE